MGYQVKRSTRQYILAAVISIAVIGGAAALTSLVVIGKVENQYALILADTRKELKDSKHTVYVSVMDIQAGEAITSSNTILQTVFAAQPEDSYITSEDIGKPALVDIKSGSQLIKQMLTENEKTSELREVEYCVINISSNIAVKDTLDVRLLYPNGESYIVLSKKVLRDYIPDTGSCYLWLAEDEQLRMSAAIVDAAFYSGSCLTVTKYMDPGIQTASIVNYTPSSSILALLETDPNILIRASQELGRKARKAMEKRLAESLMTDVSKINWNIAPSAGKFSAPAPVSDSGAKDAKDTQETSVQQEVGREETWQEGTSQYGIGQEKIEQKGKSLQEFLPDNASPQENGSLEEYKELGELQSTDDYLYYAEK